MFNVNETPEITTRQRWSHYFTIMIGLVSVALLLNLRQSYLSASSIYQNNEEGILALYPQGWLIDESGADNYIFRVRDVQAIGFKTTFQVSVSTISSQTTTRTVIDTLTMERAQTRTAYRLLSIGEYTALSDRQATIASYQFVEVDPNPFLEGVPIVVRGTDIITVNRDQAIIITMLSDINEYDNNFVIFEQFLRRLEF